MSEPKHTPGPWTARGPDGLWASHEDDRGEWGHNLDELDDEDQVATSMSIAIRAGDRVVAMAVAAADHIPDATPEDLAANALVMAAAPELLSTAVEFLRHAVRPGDDGKYDDAFDDARAALRAAIAKATGADAPRPG